MKIQPAHFTYVEKAIRGAISDKPLDELQARYRTQKLTPKRFRWDALYAATLSHWICDNLYPYMNDDHLDTALRQVMRNMDLLWAAG